MVSHLPVVAELEDDAALGRQRQAAVRERAVEAVLEQHGGTHPDAAAAEQVDARLAGSSSRPESRGEAVLALAVPQAGLEGVAVAHGRRVRALDPPGREASGMASGIDRALAVVVVLCGVLGGEIGAALLADLLRPVDLVVLEVDRLQSRGPRRGRSAGWRATRR